MPRVSTRGGMSNRGYGFGGGKKALTPVSYTFASNTANASLNVTSISGYVAGSSAITITVNAGVYLYGSTFAQPGSNGLTLTGGSGSDTITLINNGFICGAGCYYNTSGVTTPGKGISLGWNTTINNTNASAYIAGGGGWGGPSINTNCVGDGGSGAGGARGADASGGDGETPFRTGTGGAGGGPGQAGAAGSGGGQAQGSAASGGGGSGRQFPGSAGVGARVSPTGTGAGAGGGGGYGSNGGNLGASTVGQGGAGNAAGNNGAVGSGGAGGSGGPYAAGSGGGGWGASGGGSNGGGGTGGNSAVGLNGYTVTWTSGDTTRVYGSVA